MRGILLPDSGVPVLQPPSGRSRMAPISCDMCFDHDSRPPIAPIAGGALDGSRIELTAADGNRLTAFRARPSEPGRRRRRASSRRSRPPSVLRGARAAVRGARHRRGRHRLVRPDRRRRACAARRSTTCPTSRRRPGPASSADIAAGVEALRADGIAACFTTWLLHGRPDVVPGGDARPRPRRRDGLLRHAPRAVAERRAGPARSDRRHRVAGPRAVRRGRRRASRPRRSRRSIGAWPSAASIAGSSRTPERHTASSTGRRRSSRSRAPPRGTRSWRSSTTQTVG